MSRIRSWIDTDDMEREDVATLMMDEMTDLGLHRYTELSDDDGFRKQSTERQLSYIRSIKGRIDRKNQIYRPQTSEAGHITAVLFVATVYYKDLRVNDQIEHQGNFYKVQHISKTGQGFTEAELEVIE